jgi:CubicO group peptidase (beta-lactamase class C family)
LAPSSLAAAGPEDLERRVDAYLSPYVDTGNFSGAVLLARGDEVVLAKGYGQASVELNVPVTPETVFHIASVSKSFTAAAILRLEEMGKLKTSDPLAKHLPDYPNGGRITLHHLLAHASGIPNVNSFEGYEEWQMVPQTIEAMVERFRDRPLEFEPGDHYSYSNSNYNLLALVIEKVSGKSYGEFLAEQLFRPAGMTHTAHHGDYRQLISGRATGYAPAGRADLELAPQIDWSIKTGNGSLYSTLGDLSRWQRALAGSRVLSEASRRKMFTEHSENVGYGFFLRQREHGREIYMNGRSPGFGAFVGRWVGADLCVVVLMNLYSTVPTTVGRDLAGIALGDEVEPPRFRSAPPPPEVVQAVVGSYQFGPDFYVPNVTRAYFERDGHLWSNWGWEMPEGGFTFRDRTYWSEIEFVRDDSGRVIAVMVDGLRGERVEEASDEP